MNKEFELNEAIEFIDNVYQHKFDDMEEQKEDGTQAIYIDRLNDIKFTDFESASFTLLRGYGNLEYKYKQLQQENKELKYRINKLEYYKLMIHSHYGKSINILQLQHENKELYDKIEYLKSKIENKDRWCQLIADIGYEYDEYRTPEKLMSLIDELVRYALYSRDNYDYDILKDSDVDEI